MVPTGEACGVRPRPAAFPGRPRHAEWRRDHTPGGRAMNTPETSRVPPPRPGGPGTAAPLLPRDQRGRGEGGGPAQGRRPRTPAGPRGAGQGGGRPASRLEDVLAAKALVGRLGDGPLKTLIDAVG